MNPRIASPKPFPKLDTGELKGIKGKGTHKGKGTADGGVTYGIEGEYQLPK